MVSVAFPALLPLLSRLPEIYFNHFIPFLAAPSLEFVQDLGGSGTRLHSWTAGDCCCSLLSPCSSPIPLPGSFLLICLFCGASSEELVEAKLG